MLGTAKMELVDQRIFSISCLLWKMFWNLPTLAQIMELFNGCHIKKRLRPRRIDAPLCCRSAMAVSVATAQSAADAIAGTE